MLFRRRHLRVSSDPMRWGWGAQTTNPMRFDAAGGWGPEPQAPPHGTSLPPQMPLPEQHSASLQLGTLQAINSLQVQSHWQPALQMIMLSALSQSQPGMASCSISNGELQLKHALMLQAAGRGPQPFPMNILEPMPWVIISWENFGQAVCCGHC